MTTDAINAVVLFGLVICPILLGCGLMAKYFDC